LFTEAPELVASGQTGPADIFFDRINNMLIVPNFLNNSVSFLDMDIDDDNVLNMDDNCPNIPNGDQINSDSDDYGDACDNCPNLTGPCCDDADNDGFGDACDNCPEIYNPSQADINENEIGDVCEYVCGDIDGIEGISILDIVFLINYKYKAGTGPEFPAACDVNNDGKIDILDIVYMINKIYKGGPAYNCPV